MSYTILDRIINQEITGYEKDKYGDWLKLFTKKGYYVFEHDQSCCEHVYLEDICGDLEDLIGIITKAEVVKNSDDPPVRDFVESYTWTFFKLATNKGEVTLRFFGSSNGYYSEDVDVDYLDNAGNRFRIYSGNKHCFWDDD